MSARKQTIILFCTAFFLIMLVVNLLQLGGRSFISTYNNAALLMFLVLTSAQAGLYWYVVQNRVEAGRVWLALCLGVGLYALGQLVWIVYNLRGVEVPYPSVGDAFWFAAYPLMALSIINKNLLLGVFPSRGRIAFVVVIGAALFVLMGIFIFPPMFEYAPAARLVETVLNVFYALVDYVILVAASFLVIVMWRGRLSLTWNFIGAGFLTLAVSDVFFIYATWNGLYYAEGEFVNIITRAIDCGYGFSAYLLFVGVSAFERTMVIQPDKLAFEFDRRASSQPPVLQALALNPDQQGLFDKIFLMVDQDRRVYYFSQNYRDFCRTIGGNLGLKIGAALHSVLGVDEYIVNQLYSGLDSRQKTVQADLVFGNYLIPAFVDVKPARSGSDVFLRYRRKDEPAVIEERSPIEVALVEDALHSVKGIQSVSLETQETAAFFVIEVQEMYLYLAQMGGFQVGNSLVERFNQLAVAEQANVRIVDGRVVMTGFIDPKSMSKLLGFTFRTVQELTSIESTREVVRLLNDKIPQNIIRSAQNSGLAL